MSITITNNFNAGASITISNITTLTTPIVNLASTTTTNAATNKSLIYTSTTATNNIFMVVSGISIQFAVPTGNSSISISGGASNVISLINSTQTWQNKTILRANNNTVDVGIINGLTMNANAGTTSGVIRCGFNKLFSTQNNTLAISTWGLNQLLPIGTTVTGTIGTVLRAISLTTVIGPNDVTLPAANTIRFNAGTYEVMAIAQYSATGITKLFLRTIAGTNLIISMNGGNNSTKTLFLHGVVTFAATTDCGIYVVYPSTATGSGGFPANATGSQELYDSVFIRRLA